MKFFYSILILCLIASIRSSSYRCGNAFLNLLPSNVRLSRPIAGSVHVCSSIWKDGLSCCNTDPVREYSDQDIAKIRVYTQHTLQAIKELNVKLDLPHYGQAVYKYPELDFLKRYKSDSQASMYQANTLKCWNNMARYRSHALCFTCASNGAKYFTTDKKMRISSNSCSDMMNNCNEYFFDTVYLIQGMKRLRDKLKAENYNSLSPDAQEMGRWLDQIESLRLSHDLLVHINTYMSSSGSAKENAQNTICNKVFTIAHDPFIQTIFPLTKLIERKTDEIIDGIISVNSKGRLLSSVLSHFAVSRSLTGLSTRIHVTTNGVPPPSTSDTSTHGPSPDTANVAYTSSP